MPGVHWPCNIFFMGEKQQADKRLNIVAVKPVLKNRNAGNRSVYCCIFIT
jgi:hypothetical protein